MDKGNLESLAEEEEEETLVNDPVNRRGSDQAMDASSDEDDDDDDDDDDDGDGGIRRNEPNKFDLLADGVLNSLALVHNALRELLELKDELLESSLPPNVRSTVALVSGRVFRSISDMHMPVNELVRLVRVYSTPWEEKSTALKKLHEDYEAKQRQLNIAIKRLQLVEVHSKRIAKEKRIMNWEKLFAKMTTTKGHGRRWKFRIESFKQNARLGLEHLHKYIEEIEAESSDEEVEEEARRRMASDEPPTAMQITSPVSSAKMDADASQSQPSTGDDQSQPADKNTNQSDGAGTGEEKDKSVEKDESKTEADQKSGSEKEKQQEERVSDSADTSSPDSDVLHGMEEASSPDDELKSKRSKASTDTKASVTFQKPEPVIVKPECADRGVWTHEPEYDRLLHIRVYAPEGLMFRDIKCVFKCGNDLRKTDILDPVDPVQEVEEVETPAPVAGKRGLIGTRGGKPTPTETPAKENKKKKRFQELVFELPNTREKSKEPTKYKPKKPTVKPSLPENIRIAVHYGPKEEMVAMTTIDMADLKNMELALVHEPDPKGDEFDEDDYKYKYEDAEVETEPALRNKEPHAFPLYSMNPGRGDANTPIATLPLLCFWGKRVKPRTFNRITESETLTDIVYDMTGFDLRYVTKEDLHRETEERALSAICFTPELQDPVEETVSKADYDKLLLIHREEMELLQDEYQQRMQEMADHMTQMQALFEVKLQESAAVAAASAAVNGTVDSAADNMPRPTTPRRSPGSASLSRSTTSLSGHQRSLQNVPPISSAAESVELPMHTPQVPRIQRAGSDMDASRVRRVKQAKPTNLPNWGENLPKDFLDRLKMFTEGSERHRQELAERTRSETQKIIERKLAGEYKLGKETKTIEDALQDVSLPAVFMPTKTGNVYNPRAAKYFHPLGSNDFRLTQPPSMFQLPPLPKSKVTVVNLFDMSKNFRSSNADWLMQRYMQTHPNTTPSSVGVVEQEPPITPPPSYVQHSRKVSMETSQQQDQPNILAQKVSVTPTRPTISSNSGQLT